MLRSKLGFAATLSAATLVTGNMVKADDVSRSEVDALKARIAQLESAGQERVDAAVSNAKLDAMKRDNLFMMADGNAGYDNGFYIQSADGVNKFNPYVQFQLRYSLNSAGGVLNDDADIQDGFEIRRMRLGVRGTILSKDLSYDFRYSNNGGLESAYVKYKFADNMAVRAGQWEDETFRERGISGVKQLAADRSLADQVIGGGNLGYVQGASLLYEEGKIRGEVNLIDGGNSQNTNYQNNGQNFGVGVRADYLVNGDFKDAADFTAKTAKEPLLVIGGGAMWVQSGDTDVLFHTIDALWKQDAVSVYGAYIGNWAEGTTDSYNWGVVAQVGYLLPDSKWELFGRGSLAHIDSTFTDENDFYEITVGANYYFQNHNAKATIDVGYLPNGAPIGSNVTALDYVAAEGTGQLAIRGQFQLAF
ncbi:MAG: porin [Tepidisphaeraceae bacterium]